MIVEVSRIADEATPLAFLLFLVAALCIGVFAGLVLDGFRVRKAPNLPRRRTVFRIHDWNGRSRNAEAVSRQSATGPVDPVEQLRIVMGASYSAQPLLNRGEARLFRELDRMVQAANPDWQVMAQVSLGEVLRSRDLAAYRCINSKRVDLLLVDEACRPRHAIEYQGAGHHQGTAAARDAVKKEALRRAGIGYHEVIAGQTTPSELRLLVEKIVALPVRTTAPAAAEISPAEDAEPAAPQAVAS